MIAYKNELGKKLTLHKCNMEFSITMNPTHTSLVPSVTVKVNRSTNTSLGLVWTKITFPAAKSDCVNSDIGTPVKNIPVY